MGDFFSFVCLTLLPGYFIDHSQRLCDHPVALPRNVFYIQQAATHIIISIIVVIQSIADLGGGWQKDIHGLPFGFVQVILVAWVGAAIARATGYVAEYLALECRAVFTSPQFRESDSTCSAETVRTK